MGHDAGFLPGISGGLQSLLLDPNTLSSLYGAMGTTSGAFLALSQLPGINMDAVHVRLHQVQKSHCLSRTGLRAAPPPSCHLQDREILFLTAVAML